jgi:CRISPR type IV-associated protein Csf2
MKIRINAKNITPVTQIEGNEKILKKGETAPRDTIIVKTIKKNINDIIVSIPVYTANGTKGGLRRVITSIIFSAATKKNLSIDVENYHLMAAGGGNNYQQVDIETEEKIRELNPLVSAFGASLAIPGKIAISHLEPKDVEKYIEVFETDNGIFTKCRLIDTITFTIKDDVLEHNKFAKMFLTKEQIAQWEKKVSENREKRKKDRELEVEKSEKTKKESIQHIQDMQYIIPNTEFVGYIGEIVPLTDLEKGMLIKGLIEFSKEQLGSTKRWGYGVMEYEFQINEDGEVSHIYSRCDDENIYVKNIELFLSDKQKEQLELFEKWLENITEENIQIAKLLKK